jgi:hypothetical protein
VLAGGREGHAGPQLDLGAGEGKIEIAVDGYRTAQLLCGRVGVSVCQRQLADRVSEGGGRVGVAGRGRNLRDRLRGIARVSEMAATGVNAAAKLSPLIA